MAVHQELFNDSLVLDENEQINLIGITNSKESELIYRATRDGCTTEA